MLMGAPTGPSKLYKVGKLVVLLNLSQRGAIQQAFLGTYILHGYIRNQKRQNLHPAQARSIIRAEIAEKNSKMVFLAHACLVEVNSSSSQHQAGLPSSVASSCWRSSSCFNFCSAARFKSTAKTLVHMTSEAPATDMMSGTTPKTRTWIV